MSQRQFADLYGVAPGTISLWEKSQRQIPGPAMRLTEILEQSLQVQADDRLNAIESSRLRRVFKTGAALSKVGKNWMQSKLTPWYRTRDAAIEAKEKAREGALLEFIQTMSELRGFHLKLVQMFSFMKEDLPESTRSFMDSYHHELRPLAANEVIKIFNQSFQKTPFELFEEFQLQPFAFGSISQVHRAKVDGKDVAVKVQYPGITKALKGDLKNIDLFAKFLTVVMGFNGTDAMVREMRDRFLEECDYELEASHLEMFASMYEGSDWLHVPKVFNGHSSSVVLTIEYVEGLSFQEVCRLEDSSRKDRFGERIFQFHFESIYQHGVFNADPHPGNYKLVGDKLAVLDFGCVRKFSEGDVTRFRNLFVAVMAGDLEAFKEANRSLGIIDNEEKFDYLQHYETIMLMMEPVTQPTFTFNHYYIRELVRVLFSDNANLKNARMVEEGLFIQRLQFGMFSLLADLNASGNWKEIYKNATGIDPTPKKIHSQLKL